MLCALADFFDVTTDKLLGRARELKYAVIAARSEALGQRIQELARNYGIAAKAIYTTYAEALAHTERDNSVMIMLVSLDKPLTEEDLNASRSGVVRVNVNCDTDQEILDGFAMYLNHMDAFQALGEKAVKHD